MNSRLQKNLRVHDFLITVMVHTVYYVDPLHSRLQSIVSDMTGEFIGAMKIPDGLFRGRNTWFLLSEFQFVIVDMVFPLRVVDSFDLVQFSSAKITDSEPNSLLLEQEAGKDIIIQLSTSEAVGFGEVVVEQVELLS